MKVIFYKIKKLYTILMNSNLRISSFPVHSDKNFKVYNIYDGLQLISNPIVYQGCTTLCYQQLNTQQMMQMNQLFCQKCGNLKQQSNLFYDVGYKNVLNKYKKKLKSLRPLYVKINPYTQKVLFSQLKKGFEEEMAYQLYQQIYSNSIDYLKFMNVKKCNLSSIKKQIQRIFRHQKSVQTLYSFCRGPTSLSKPTILLFLTSDPHTPQSYQIQWITNSQTQPQILDRNVNHNAVITYLQKSQTQRYLIMAISGKIFHIFVASFNPIHNSIDHNKKIIKFFEVAEFSYKRQYPSIYTNHISKHIFILGGFSEYQYDNAVRTDIWIHSISWEQNRPEIKYNQKANIFPFKGRITPILRGFSLTNMTQSSNLEDKLKAIRNNSNPEWFSVGGLSKNQRAIVIQSPSFRKISYPTSQQKNPVQQLTNFQVDPPQLACFYPILTEYPIIDKKNKKSERYINLAFMLRNTYIPMGQNCQKMLQTLIINMKRPVQIFYHLRKFMNEEISQNIQENGDNYISLLHNNKQFYLRTNLSLKKCLQHPQSGQKIHYLSVQYFFQRGTHDIKIKYGYANSQLK